MESGDAICFMDTSELLNAILNLRQNTIPTLFFNNIFSNSTSKSCPRTQVTNNQVPSWSQWGVCNDGDAQEKILGKKNVLRKRIPVY